MYSTNKQDANLYLYQRVLTAEGAINAAVRCSHDAVRREKIPHIHCCDVNIFNTLLVHTQAKGMMLLVAREGVQKAKNRQGVQKVQAACSIRASTYFWPRDDFLFASRVELPTGVLHSDSTWWKIGSKRCNGSLLAPPSYYGRCMQQQSSRLLRMSAWLAAWFRLLDW